MAEEANREPTDAEMKAFEEAFREYMSEAIRLNPPGSTIARYPEMFLPGWLLAYRSRFSVVPECSYCGVRPHLLPSDGQCVQCGAALL